LWWLGTGLLLVSRRVAMLGWLTVVLGAFALVDALMTAAGVDGPAYLLAGPKLPLGWIWAAAVGARLLRDPTLQPDTPLTTT
jgi:hypothetical protein